MVTQINNITYRSDVKPNLDEAINLYSHCSLGERRPLSDRARFQAMLDNANIISAWDRDKLVGIARYLTDFVYTTYLADLAVDDTYQNQGIGKQLIKELQKATTVGCRIVLLAAPKAVGYYPHIGFEAHSSAWTILEPLK
ncbi:GNAT family N-acetyltransferase [Orbus sturtevantii]|uniref:GNAT family N-acetyltransferase n=1 Tax=Orbus sturtevantii TaxID=3074109 RepID=UPI00370D0F31